MDSTDTVPEPGGKVSGPPVIRPVDYGKRALCQRSDGAGRDGRRLPVQFL